ncbi:MAG: hypothetical protein U5L95_02340 [Candidatus Saccharibacteria bacterium]|nr:hypothetical protein [Candidatus Saccharibacteria bacterium]
MAAYIASAYPFLRKSPTNGRKIHETDRGFWTNQLLCFYGKLLCKTRLTTINSRASWLCEALGNQGKDMF